MIRVGLMLCAIAEIPNAEGTRLWIDNRCVLPRRHVDALHHGLELVAWPELHKLGCAGLDHGFNTRLPLHALQWSDGRFAT